MDSAGSDGRRDPRALRVLITGGTSGIGLATALRFAQRGATVAVVARNEPGLTKTRRAIEKAGGRPVTIRADVTDRERLERGVKRAVGAMGGLDVAISNVGAAAYGPFVDTSPEDFDRTLDVTFRGSVNTIRAVLPHLEGSSGTLIAIGSAAVDFPLPLMSAYTAAKHALRGFLDALRIELRSQGSSICVTLVEPGPVDTPFWNVVASENGRLPPKIPLPYAAGEVARAIERSVARPAPRVAVGGLTRLLQTAHRIARPVSDRVLAQIANYARNAGEPRPGAAAIWNPSGNGELGGGLGGRPSILVRSADFAARTLPRRMRAPFS